MFFNGRWLYFLLAGYRSVRAPPDSAINNHWVLCSNNKSRAVFINTFQLQNDRRSIFQRLAIYLIQRGIPSIAKIVEVDVVFGIWLFKVVVSKERMFFGFSIESDKMLVLFVIFGIVIEYALQSWATVLSFKIK